MESVFSQIGNGEWMPCSVLFNLWQLSSLLIRFTSYDIDRLTLAKELGGVDEDNRQQILNDYERALGMVRKKPVGMENGWDEGWWVGILK